MKKGMIGVIVVLLMGTLFVSCTCRNDKAMYKSIPVGVIVAGADGKIANANKPLQEMLGYTLSELEALTWQDITPKKWHAMEDEMIKIAKEQPYVIYRKSFTKKDGTALPIQIIGWVKADKDGKVSSSGGVVWPLDEGGFSSGAAAPAEPAIKEAPEESEATDTTAPDDK